MPVGPYWEAVIHMRGYRMSESALMRRSWSKFLPFSRKIFPLASFEIWEHVLRLGNLRHTTFKCNANPINQIVTNLKFKVGRQIKAKAYHIRGSPHPNAHYKAHCYGSIPGKCNTQVCVCVCVCVCVYIYIYMKRKTVYVCKSVPSIPVQYPSKMVNELKVSITS
jgi:hypothetical protein